MSSTFRPLLLIPIQIPYFSRTQHLPLPELEYTRDPSKKHGELNYVLGSNAHLVAFQVSSPDVEKGKPTELICYPARLYDEAYTWYMLSVMARAEQLSLSFRINIQKYESNFYICGVNGIVKTDLPPELR